MIDIIIPTYGQEKYTIECLESIRKYTNKNDYRIIWVDNGSTAKSRRQVLTELKKHNYLTIWMSYRAGFVKAVNLGIKSSRNEYAVIMNNDTRVVPFWLERLKYPMEVESGIGLTGPTTTEGTSRQSWDILKKENPREWHSMPVLDGLDDLEIAETLYSVYENYYTCDVGTIAFFCAMIRRNVFAEIGLLDEDFEDGYSDDVDFSIRAKKAGYEIALVPSTFIHHYNRTTFLSIYSNEEISEKLHANRAKLKKKHKIKGKSDNG